MRGTTTIACFSVLFMLGCGSPSSPPPDVPAPPPPPADGGPGAAAADDAGDDGPCEVVGMWHGPVLAGILQGNVMRLEFFADGRAVGIADWVTLESRWELRDDVVEITDVRANPALAACPSDDVGRYTVTFEPDCQAVVVGQGEDPCRHRRMALQGLRATRQ